MAGGSPSKHSFRAVPLWWGGSGNSASAGAVQQWTVARWLPSGGQWVCPCPVALDSRQKSPERVVGEREPSVPVLRTFTSSDVFAEQGRHQCLPSKVGSRVCRARSAPVFAEQGRLPTCRGRIGTARAASSARAPGDSVMCVGRHAVEKKRGAGQRRAGTQHVA